RSQRFVIQARQTKRFLQLFRESLKRLQMVGCSRDFRLGRLEKLLVSAVDQLRNLTSNQVARICEDLYRVVGSLLDGSRHVVFTEKYAAVGAGCVGDVEPMPAQPG